MLPERSYYRFIRDHCLLFVAVFIMLFYYAYLVMQRAFFFGLLYIYIYIFPGFLEVSLIGFLEGFLPLLGVLDGFCWDSWRVSCRYY